MAKRRLGILFVFLILSAIRIVCGYDLGSGEGRGREDESKLAHRRIAVSDRNRNRNRGEKAHVHDDNGDPDLARCQTRHGHIAAVDASSYRGETIPACARLLNSPHILRPVATTTAGPSPIVTREPEAQNTTPAPVSDEYTGPTSNPGWVIVQTLTFIIQPTNANFHPHSHTRLKEFTVHAGKASFHPNPTHLNPTKSSCTSPSSDSNCTEALKNRRPGGAESKYQKAQMRRQVVAGCIIGAFMGCLALGLVGVLCWGWVKGRRKEGNLGAKIVEGDAEDRNIASSS